MHSIQGMIKESPRIDERWLLLEWKGTRMEKQTTFATVALDEIRHLIPQAENSDSDVFCQSCGHPAGDHSVENDTCWHADQRDGTVTLCHCQGWIFDEDETDQPAAG